MPLPDEVRRLIDDARRSLRRDAQGALRLPWRKLLWTAMGPVLMDGSHAVRGVGLIRRANLAILAVERVLPLWDAHYPRDDTPRRVLSTARRYLRRRVSWDAAWRLFGEGWVHGDNVGCEAYDTDDSEGMLISMVCHAAAKALATALKEEKFDPDDGDGSAEDDGDRDPYEVDAAYTASVVAAGGFARDDDSDPRKRRAYWRWYLEEAVPAAWRAGHPKARTGRRG